MRAGFPEWDGGHATPAAQPPRRRSSLAPPMALRRSSCLLASFAILGGACATSPHAALAVEYERQVALRPDLATAIAAGALRHALPFADPLPQANGAPALDLGGN